MTFVVNGIQQKTNTTTPLQLLVVSDSSLLVRKLLEKYNVLILSIKESSANPKSFGDVWAKVKRGFDGITLISNQSDLTTVCKLFVSLGFEIITVNSFSHPLPDEEISALLVQISEAVKGEEDAQEGAIQAQKAHEKKIYSDNRLHDAQEVAGWIFTRTVDLIERVRDLVPSQDIKKIRTMEEDLKKLKLGNNYEKIRELAAQILHIMQSWEDIYFVSQQTKAQPLIAESLLTDVDLSREEVRQRYMLQRKQLGSKIMWLQEDYALFGNISLLRKFFQKDILHKISQPQIRLYHLYDLLLFCVGLLLSLTGVWYIYNMLRPVTDNLNGLRLQISKLGILGLLLFAGNFWKRKNIGNLILIYGGTVLVYRLLVVLITTNFAL